MFKLHYLLIAKKVATKFFAKVQLIFETRKYFEYFFYFSKVIFIDFFTFPKANDGNLICQ